MPIHDAIRQRLQPVAASVTSNRIMLYAFFSTCAMLGAIANACINQSNFYSVMIHLSRSGRSVLILANFGFLATLFVGRVLQRIFFGPLQPREVERLYDQTWMFVTESLLAFTIFRDEFDIPFVLMFGFLLFVKCFHWLMADRVESMDQVTYPGPPVLFHIRMNALMFTLSAIDFFMFMVAVDTTLNNGVGGMVLFATEYAILMASSLNAMARYSLNNLDYRRASTRGGENAAPWEHKSMYVFYIELATDFLKLATYLTFFTIILTFYGLPLNIIRDVYLTARSFISRLRALVRYHNATRDMERRYPTATEEELAAMSDRTCIICREELASAAANVEGQAAGDNAAVPPPLPPQDGPNMTPKKLPCGHVFHFQCLRSWLERQQSCPTCRRTVLETDHPNRNANQQQNARGQQGNGAGRAAPPQPGAAPQPFQFQPGQAPQQQQDQNYLLRIARRALGIAGQPPLVPGQFPNGFGPQNMPFGGPPPPPGYYYNPYYPYPPPPPQPQQLHAAPIVRGFYGPGGVWYPWALEQGQGQDQNPPPAPTPSAAQAQPHSQPPPAPGAVPVSMPLAPGAVPPLLPATVTPTTVTQPAASTSSAPASGESVSSVSSISSTDASEDEENKTPSGSSTVADAATPRDAAAQAALRRLGSLPGSSSKSSSAVTTASRTTSAISSAVEVRPSTTVRPTPTSSVSATNTSTTSATAISQVTSPQAQPTPTSVTAPTSNVPAPSSTTSPPSTSTTTNTRAPALLPLHDTSRPVGAQGFNYIHPQHMTNPYMNPNVPYAWRPSTASARPTPSAGSTGHPRPSPYPSAAHAHSQRGGSTSAAAALARFRPNLSTLPSTLTDEQLARLDRVTRDAIDERLRVLEGVSTAVHRCIEELTRVRSVLPPGTVGSALSGVPMGQPAPPGAVNTPAATAATAAAPVTPSTPSATTIVDPGVPATSPIASPTNADVPTMFTSPPPPFTDPTSPAPPFPVASGPTITVSPPPPQSEPTEPPTGSGSDRREEKRREEPSAEEASAEEETYEEASAGPLVDLSE
ncbi:E3 ubiquitin-protein ligase hrd1 [Steccherinum ochraceum]|uniref:RING-type E3 ubiquitin transferase n=1 Tax=Steccherinum ochraceum TaxID=92696 RepID=A0A4R0RGD6_9APHY|nr:E3 ubiquitin-protein ligase hrd1 [Steccherinum ochraceum]